MDVGDRLIVGIGIAAVALGAGAYVGRPVPEMPLRFDAENVPNWVLRQAIVDKRNPSMGMVVVTKSANGVVVLRQKHVKRFHLKKTCWENSTYCFEASPDIEDQ